MNTPKKLTPGEVDALYVFTRKHFVEYYDLQTELVDHLANGIEEQWQHNQNPDFEDALAAEFKKFGIYGFSDVVAERKRALGKRYTKLLGRYFVEFFTLPKILLTLAMVFGIHLMLLLPTLYIFMFFFISIQGFSLFKFKQRNNFLEKKVKQTGKRWLLEELIYKGATVSTVVIFATQFIQFIDNAHNVYLHWFLSVITVLIILHNYVVLYSIPAKAQEYLKETYPEYEIEKS
ncbi:hypothetical protein [Flavobacterium rhizosphaerae]|uniref:Uncharacterized protein n=1 Tax=Flavobacterium rhizosphaerae TaxID=3163298 RepID=A0ABW8Z172_9FLAO